MILESQEKDQLYTALSEAQSEYPTIRVNRKAFKNEYADLHAILKPIRGILHKNGLSVHEVSVNMDGNHWYGVRLAHESDQYITNLFPFTYDDPKQSDQKTHKMAGSQTYFFRYYVKGILGLTISDDEDDDDMQGHYEQKQVNPEKQPQSSNLNPYFQPLTKSEVVTAEQLEEIHHVLEGQPEIAKKVLSGFNIDSLAYIPKDQYLKTIERIRFLKDQYNNVKK